MPEKRATIKEALSLAAMELSKADVPDPLAEAEYLLTHILGCKRHGLFLNPSRLLTDSEAAAFTAYMERRKKREPAQYITGEVEFRGHTFMVTRATLIPRPETELLVDEALAAAKPQGGETVVVDLCTGSGCIAVSVAKELAGSRVYAADVSTDAIKAARGNASLNGVAEKVGFFIGDLFKALPEDLKGKVDIILSNPPYVARSEMQGLAPEVKDYEPETALCGGAEGLDFIERIIDGAPEYLKKGAYLIMEIGFGQSEKVKELASKDGRYEKIEVRKDYSGIDRVFIARVRG
ncbi:MAG: peptide chain release factor N(5)-glutamine methyltransferase [Deltaproteobacteria bacterium]|nr:peptide chain release factor N(5)-glutamine methyltransferase [Deltaproteobacteria bacterium]